MIQSLSVKTDQLTNQLNNWLAFVLCLTLTLSAHADGNETNAAWKRALAETDRPTMLILTRQNLPVLEGTKELAAEGVNKGAISFQKQKVTLTVSLLQQVLK